MTTRTADSGPTRETLRSYIGAFLLGLKDNGADADDVRAVLDELLPPAAGPEIKLGLIRHWPDGMAARVEKVWLDLPGFTIDYKLFDLSRALAEFGFTLKVFEGAPEKMPALYDDPQACEYIDRMVQLWATKQRAPAMPSYSGEAIKDAPPGYYWRQITKGSACAPLRIACLEKNDQYITLTTDGNSDYAIHWPLQSTDDDGQPDGQGPYPVEATDFVGITLYGPLVPPSIEGARP